MVDVIGNMASGQIGGSCCVCGDVSVACYGKFIGGRSVFVRVCQRHVLSSAQKFALLGLPFRNKTDAEILHIILGAVRFIYGDDDRIGAE